MLYRLNEELVFVQLKLRRKVHSINKVNKTLSYHP